MMDKDARRICDEVIEPLIDLFEVTSQTAWDCGNDPPVWVLDDKRVDMYRTIEREYEKLDLPWAKTWIEFNLGVDRAERFQEILLGAQEVVRRVESPRMGENVARYNAYGHGKVDEQDFLRAQETMAGTIEHLRQLVAMIQKGLNVISDKAPESRLIVSLDPPQVTIDGTAYAVAPDGADFVKTLVDADGDWISSTDAGWLFRPDRVLKALPPAVQQLVEPRTGSGYRISRQTLLA